jgi:hypothetical protein
MKEVIGPVWASLLNVPQASRKKAIVFTLSVDYTLVF